MLFNVRMFTEERNGLLDTFSRNSLTERKKKKKKKICIVHGFVSSPLPNETKQNETDFLFRRNEIGIDGGEMFDWFGIDRRRGERFVSL